MVVKWVNLSNQSLFVIPLIHCVKRACGPDRPVLFVEFVSVRIGKCAFRNVGHEHLFLMPTNHTKVQSTENASIGQSAQGFPQTTVGFSDIGNNQLEGF